MTELATIERSDVEVTPTSWQPTGEMSFDEWIEAGRRLWQMQEAVQWWIGDWINYGEPRYGEKYDDALNAGYEYSTLTNMAWVASKFESSRRRENLSWSHHEAVAGLNSAEEQDAALARAEREGLSSKQLRPGANGDRRPASLTVTLIFSQTFRNKQIKRTTVEALKAEADRLGFTEK